MDQFFIFATTSQIYTVTFKRGLTLGWGLNWLIAMNNSNKYILTLMQ